MSGLIQSIFGGGGGGGQQQQQLQMPNFSPTAVAPPPARSDADIQAAADAQRRKYGISGGRTPTNLTGGLGVPTSSLYSAAVNLLGGSA